MKNFKLLFSLLLLFCVGWAYGQSNDTQLTNLINTNIRTATTVTRANHANVEQAIVDSKLSVLGVYATSGTNTYTVTVPASVTSYIANQIFPIRFSTAATGLGPFTLNINGLGAKTLVKQGSTAIVASDIKIGQDYIVIVDGTNIQLVGGGGSGGAGGDMIAANNLSDVVSVPTSRTNLGATIVGANLFTATNPSAVTWPRINADNTITFRSAAQMLSDIGGQTAGSYLSVGNNLSDVASASTSRTNLGLGTFATLNNPMTTTGDIIIGGGSGAPARLAATTNGFVLTLVSGSPAWQASSGGGGNMLSANNLSDVASVPTSRINLGGTTAGINVFTVPNPSAITWLRINADNTVSTRTASQTTTDLGALAAANNLSDVANAATSRGNLGATTVGGNIFTAVNPSAVRWVRVNADNTITFRTALETLTDIGLDTDGTLAANSDAKVPSQKAVKTYVDTQALGPYSTTAPGYVNLTGGASRILLGDNTTNANFTYANTGFNVSNTNNITFGQTAQSATNTFVTITQAAHTGGSDKGFVFIGGASTGLTGNSYDFGLILSRTKQYVTGDLASEYSAFINPPTYAFVGASTITNTATFSVAGAPSAGTNATITNTHGLIITSVSLLGTVTNSYGLTVNAHTGATNNYAAQFLGGSTFVAAGTTTYAPLIVPSGTNLSTTKAGALENDGSHLYFTFANSGTRFQLDQQAGTTPNPATTDGDLIQWLSGAYVRIPDVATGNTLLSGGAGAIWTTGKIGLTTHVSGTLPIGNGGTGLTVYAIGDILTASGTTTLSSVADVAAGAYLRSGGVSVIPLWSTLILPNSATANRVAFASSTNTYGESANLTFVTNRLSGTTLYMTVSAGTTGAGTAPIKFTAGTLMTTAEAFGVETNANSFYQTKNSTLRYGQGGVIFDNIADANNGTTVETDLYTYTTPANTLAEDADKIVCSYIGTFNDVTATGQLKVYFAGTAIGNTGALTISATGGWVAQVLIIRTSSTTARAAVNISTPGASTALYTAETDLTGLTLSGTNIIKITGQAGGASGGSNDITGKFSMGYFFPAAHN